MTIKIIQLLLDYWPESSRQLDDFGETAVQNLCNNLSIDDMTSLETATLLIESYPEALWLEDAGCRQLPIHHAARNMSPEFLKLLLNNYPESIPQFVTQVRVLCHSTVHAYVADSVP